MESKLNKLTLLRQQRDECINLHKWSEALRVVEEMIKISPSPSSYTRRGMLQMKLKNYRDATDSFKMALKMDSSYQRAREILVKLSARMDETCTEVYQGLLKSGISKSWDSSDLSMTHFDIKPTESSIIPLVDMNDTEIIEISPLSSETTIAQYPIPTKKINKKLGAYDIVEIIGVGGMGKVYKAYHPDLEREVAVKVMHADIECDKQRQRFFTEAKLMAKLHHPNIVSIHDVGTIDEQDYIVMDYIKGESLRSLILKKSLTFKESVEVVRLVALAMEYAHRNEIIHRDLKPANIMFDEDTKLPVVMDFGLAKNLQPSGDVTRSGEILGTPRYMAPEQAEGRQSLINATTDVYALGAVMYELLTHTAAVGGNDPASIIYNILYKEVIPLRKINPKLSPGLEAICLKCLEKNQQHRYQHAKLLADDIERLLNGEMIVAKRLGFAQRVARKLKYHKSTVVLSVVFILILISSLISMHVLNTINRENKIQDLLLSSQKRLEEAKTSQELKEKFPDIAENAVSRKQLQNEIEESMYKHMHAKLLLEQALTLAPEEKELKESLYSVEKEIGLLALLGQNYILSELSFSRCINLTEKEEAKILLSLVKEDKNLLRKQNLEHFEKIMLKLKNSPPEAGMMDEYITELVRIGESYIVRALIPYLKYGSKWEKILAIETLGKIGDRNTKYKGQDVIECLLEELKELDVNKNGEEAEKIVWALGRLRDSRADDVVNEKRTTAGQYSVFWNRTIIPYKWIPLNEASLANKDEYYERGKKWYLKGHLEKAIADFTKVIELNSNYVEAFNVRGICYHNKNEIAKAISDYSKAIELDPQYIKAYNNRGTCYQEIKEFAKAISDYSKALEIDSKFHFSYANRASCYKEQGDIEKAIEDYNMAIDMSSANEDYYTGRGDCYRKKQDYKKALADHAIAIQINSKYAVAYRNRALCYQEQLKLERAVEDFSTAIQLEPTIIDNYLSRATCYEQMNDLINAISDYNIAIQINDQKSDLYLQRGLCYEKQQEWDKALKDYNKAITIAESVKSRLQRALFYIAHNNKELAIIDLEKCLTFSDITSKEKQRVTEYLQKYRD